MRENAKLDSVQLADLGSQFTFLAGRLASGDRPMRADRVVSMAGAVLPHAHHSGITLLRAGHEPESLAVSDELPSRVDALQYEVDDGPCLDASRADDAVLSQDLTTDDRWPGFAPRCVELTGVRSMLSVRVYLPTAQHRAALNFYARDMNAFDDLDLRVAAIFAPFAGMAVTQVLHEREVANLTTALGTSRQIGTAIGILMGQYKVTSGAAFAMLSRASQHLNRKLRDVAADVELTGELPQRAVDRERGSG